MKGSSWHQPVSPLKKHPVDPRHRKWHHLHLFGGAEARNRRRALAHPYPRSRRTRRRVPVPCQASPARHGWSWRAPGFQSEYVGLTQFTVLGEFVAGLARLDSKPLQGFCEQPVTCLSWETDTGWSTPAVSEWISSTGANVTRWSGITLSPCY